MNSFMRNVGFGWAEESTSYIMFTIKLLENTSAGKITIIHGPVSYRIWYDQTTVHYPGDAQGSVA